MPEPTQAYLVANARFHDTDFARLSLLQLPRWTGHLLRRSLLESPRRSGHLLRLSFLESVAPAAFTAAVRSTSTAKAPTTIGPNTEPRPASSSPMTTMGLG